MAEPCYVTNDAENFDQMASCLKHFKSNSSPPIINPQKL